MHLMNLADEILLEVLDYLTPQALYRLSACSRRLCSLALPALYRVIKLDKFREQNWEDANFDAFIRTLALHPERTDWVREAHLRWRCTDNEYRDRIFSLLPKMSNIRTLRLEENNSTNLPPILPYHAPPSWIKHLLTQLACCNTATKLRSLTVMDYQTMVDDVFKLFDVPRLDYLCVAKLDVRPSEELPQFDRQPVSRIEVLEFKECSPPMGPLVKVMLGGHHRLRKFTWGIDSRRITSQLSPAAITDALEPLKSTVEELHLSISPGSWTYAGNDGTQMDFASFSRLKVLKIHDSLLFAFDPILQLSGWTGSGHCFDVNLYQRLPPFLESLYVLFDLGFWRRWRDGGTTETYEWMTSLVEHKNLHLPLLRQVTVMERMKKNYQIPSSEALLGNRLWEFPGNLKRVIDSTGVNFEVWTMPPTTITSWISL